MPIDIVAVKRRQLDQAAKEGSLNNEQAFRASIEKFQDGVREHTPSVVNISTSAERQFDADLTNLKALIMESSDPEIRRLGGIILRMATYFDSVQGRR